MTRTDVVFARVFRHDAVVAMLARAVQGATMALAAALVISRTSAVDQGFFFTFISLGILLQLCDFGLSYASLQAASHLLATGKSEELGALTSRAARINAIGTLVATIGVAVAGAAMFGEVDRPSASWAPAWIAFVVGVGVNHLTAPYAFIVEGGVSVARAWRFRLFQELSAGGALIVVLAAGFGLWSLVAYYWVRCAVAFVWMRRATIAVHFAATERLSMRRWQAELWPFQWRVGLGAVGSYLVFQAFGPILFALEGPTEAGRFALSMSVMNAIVMVTTAWPISQAAHFGVMVGRRDADRLLAHWTRLVVASTAFAALGSGLAIAGFFVLRAWLPALTMRFADPSATSLLIASAVPHHLVACFAVVLRSERRDPLLPLGIVGGLTTVIAMTFAASGGPLDRVAATYLFCTAATVPIAYAVYRRFAARQLADVVRA
jgi:hypothetical protein